MNVHRIGILTQLIPPGAPYLSRIPRTLRALGIPAEVDVHSYTSHDPQFGWNYVKSFLACNIPLPPQTQETPLLRTYAHLRYKHPDPDVTAALSLEHSLNYQRCLLTRCLLLKQYEDSTIAHLTGATQDSVRIYENLFWNTRGLDRIDLASRVFPESRQVELRPGYHQNESVMNLALRAAWDWGLPAVEQFLGLSNPGANSASIGQQASALAAKILSTANFLLKMGFAHQNLPPVSVAVRLLRMAKSLAHPERDVSGMTIDRNRLGAAVSQAMMRFVGTDLQVGAPTEIAKASADVPLSDDSYDLAQDEFTDWDGQKTNEVLPRAA